MKNKILYLLILLSCSSIYPMKKAKTPQQLEQENEIAAMKKYPTEIHTLIWNNRNRDNSLKDSTLVAVHQIRKSLGQELCGFYPLPEHLLNSEPNNKIMAYMTKLETIPASDEKDKILKSILSILSTAITHHQNAIDRQPIRPSSPKKRPGSPSKRRPITPSVQLDTESAATVVASPTKKSSSRPSSPTKRRTKIQNQIHAAAAAVVSPPSKKRPSSPSKKRGDSTLRPATPGVNASPRGKSPSASPKIAPMPISEERQALQSAKAQSATNKKSRKYEKKGQQDTTSASIANALVANAVVTIAATQEIVSSPVVPQSPSISAVDNPTNPEPLVLSPATPAVSIGSPSSPSNVASPAPTSPTVEPASVRPPAVRVLSLDSSAANMPQSQTAAVSTSLSLPVANNAAKNSASCCVIL